MSTIFERIPMLAVLHEVAEERKRQEGFVESGKFNWTCASPDAPDNYKLPVLLEEVGEVARAMLEGNGLREELIQVAAVAVAWAEAIPPDTVG